MGISERQHSAANLKLLRAQRHLYTQAKRLQCWRMIGTIGLAAAAPLIYYLFPNSRTILAIIGGVWLIASRGVLEDVEAKQVKQAATVQEQFDVDLYGLAWNEVLVGDRVSPELINSAAADFKGDAENLGAWYADTGNIPYPLDVLLCQRSNLVWDWRLRRYYALMFCIFVAVLFSSEIIAAVWTKLTFLDYLLALLIPSLAALLNGLEIAKAHFRLAEEEKAFEQKVSALWRSGLDNPRSITIEQCRDIQDRIYTLRSARPLVPDILYAWLRDKYEFDMQSAVAELKSAVEQRREQNKSEL